MKVYNLDRSNDDELTVGGGGVSDWCVCKCDGGADLPIVQ